MKINEVPIITYCYSPSCNASHHLINELHKAGFYNIIEYPGGIIDWF